MLSDDVLISASTKCGDWVVYAERVTYLRFTYLRFKNDFTSSPFLKELSTLQH